MIYQIPTFSLNVQNIWQFCLYTFVLFALTFGIISYHIILFSAQNIYNTYNTSQYAVTHKADDEIKISALPVIFIQSWKNTYKCSNKISITMKFPSSLIYIQGI